MELFNMNTKKYSDKQSVVEADLQIPAGLSLFVLINHLIGIIAVPALPSRRGGRATTAGCFSIFTPDGLHHCANFIQHIIRNIKFCFGVKYGQASCFIKNKCIIQRFCNLFNCIIDLFLYGLDQFLAFQEEVSIPSKALLLKIFGFFFFLDEKSKKFRIK